MTHRTVSTFVLALLLGVALPARAEDVPISPDARAHFAAGVNLLQDPDGAKYEEAYGEFKAAYQISPSWKISATSALPLSSWSETGRRSPPSTSTWPRALKRSTPRSGRSSSVTRRP